MQIDACHQNDRMAGPAGRPIPREAALSRPSPVRARSRTRALAALGAIFAFAILATTAAPLPMAPSATGSGGSAVSITSSAFGNCNKVGSLTPSALLQGIMVPGRNVTSGGNLSAVMEVMAQNWTPSMSNISVHFPSIFFNFPRASGGNQQLFLSNRSILMNFSGWSNASLAATRNYTFPSGLAFLYHGVAKIDSMKLAVTATADYGQITIEVRWQWIFTPILGRSVHGPWSVPTNTSNWPKSVPSIFYPAPYTTFLASSGATAVIGTNYTATLGGDVAGRTFFLEMEYPSGSVVQAFLQTAPANATTFLVRIPIINYNSYLAPGAFLIHIHDACGAMLYNKTIHAVFAPSARIQFLLSPTACASKSITFNGSKFTNGTYGNFAPSTTNYTFAIPYCAGHHFNGWLTTGALHIASSTTMLVSYNGTFTVFYT
jgi:hypothetical protein